MPHQRTSHPSVAIDVSDTSSPHDAAPAPIVSASRRGFLKVAGAVAAGAAAATVGCAPADSDQRREGGEDGRARRDSGFDRQVLGALGDVMLPESLGAAGRAAAVTAFVAWVDGYDPVAQEMLGYGYSDIRYLPPDPAPAWRAQLEALDLLARKMRQKPFVELDGAARKDVVTAALASVAGERLPDPLGASHVAVALVAHWAGSPAAWDLALGVQVGAGTCRKLEGVISKPLPIVGVTA
jgi:hypothetical protein